MNIGVRLGSPSKIGKNFLACLDVDIRHPQWEKVAEETLQEALIEIGAASTPLTVESGSGKNSRHLYFLTDSPFRQTTFGEKKKEWGVVGYSEGRQMVLPPSVHPDTGRRYRWRENVTPRESSDFPVCLSPQLRESVHKKGGSDAAIVENWEPAPGARLLVLELSPEMRRIVETGDVEDRSSSLVPVTRALISIGASEKEILSILSDPAFGLSRCAFDHVQSGDRRRAVKWLWKYTVERLWLDHSRAPGVFQKVERGLPPPPSETAWMDELRRTREGQIRSELYNISLILQNRLGNGVFRKNEFSNRIIFGARTFWKDSVGEQFADEDVHVLQEWLSREYQISVPQSFIWTAVVVLAREYAFHPVRDYLNSLEWDGVARVNTWMRDYLGAGMPEPYLSEVSRKFLLAAVKRVMEPGCKFDHMVVLEGPQGIGKSSVPFILARDWYMGALPNIRDKDALIALQGAWLIEISELATLRRVDAESYKAFFSGSIDRFRVPYGRATEEFPRQCIFIGTTNHGDYLSDNTGNRRFWPVRVRKCQFKKLARDRDQLWAEARVLYETFGEELYLTGKTRRLADEIQESRVAENEELMMQRLLQDFVEVQQGIPETERFDFSRFRLETLFGVGGPYFGVPKKNWTLQLAARALVHQGFERYKTKGLTRWSLPT